MGPPLIDVCLNGWVSLSAAGVGAVFFFAFALLPKRALGKRTAA